MGGMLSIDDNANYILAYSSYDQIEKSAVNS